MRFTTSLRQNHEFRRLYYRGKSVQGRYTAVYSLKKRGEGNRLGITVGAKVGGAVLRNRLRRLIKESYRLLEPEMRQGFDIVVVGRGRGVSATYSDISRDIRRGLEKLGVVK